MTDTPRIKHIGDVAFLTGAATLDHVGDLEAAVAAGGALNLSRLAALDTAGAYVLIRSGVALDDARPEHRNLLETVVRARPVAEPSSGADRSIRARVAGVGRMVVGGGQLLAGLASYLGLFLAGLFRAVLAPRQFRLTALVAHCMEVGVRAVPIVALMAFLIGVVLAFQGSAQLKQFGAEVFVVDLIAVSVIRELGILLTSIIVAGRTASAYTAAIGSMKMREEIDAMQTLGIDPAQALIVPRVLALIVMLPILGLIANLTGLFGGALMSWVVLDISPAMFATRLVDGTSIGHVIVGMSKAPVFALIIGIVGCHAGMQVRGNAESLGMMTSKAVVTAIFAVIMADALFSIFYAEIGL